MVPDSAATAKNRLEHPLPLTDQKWPAEVVPLVSILCITYNHEKFIEDCLQGLLMQETSFPVEIIVHDDASTDRTKEIVKNYSERYPRLIKPVLQERNQYSLGNKPGLLAASYAAGEFIATCEGDDYWTSPSKLQRQIDFLLGDPDRLVCGGRVAVIREGSATPYKIEPHQEPELLSSFTPVDMLHGRWVMRTASRVARKSVWTGYMKSVNGSSLACDYLFKLYCISVGRDNPEAFGCLDEVVAVYREHAGGVWSSIGEQERRRESLRVLRLALSRFDFGEHRPYVQTTIYQTLVGLKHRSLAEEVEIVAFRARRLVRKLLLLGRAQR